MRQRAAIIGLVFTVVAATLTPVSAAETAPQAPSSIEVDENGNVSWVRGAGRIDSQIVEWQDTRVPHGWLDESSGLATAGIEFEPFIVGGDDANIRRHGYNALLLGWDRNNDAVVQCGGSIIAPRWVVTAAHCTRYRPTGTYYAEPEYFSVVYGLGDWTDIPDDLDHNLRFSDAVHVPPEYANGGASHDIALVRLEGAVDPANADPIPLFDLDGPADGSAAYVTGWGATVDGGFTNEELQGLDVTVDAACGTWPTDHPDEWDDDQFLCASGLPGGACNGDSGGPLVVNRSGVVMLAGVVSFGSLDGCAESADEPDVYTRVSSHVDWIESITGPLGGQRTLGSGRSSTTLDGLRPGRTYAVTVKAVNEGGVGAAITSFTTPGTMIHTAEELGIDCRRPQPHDLVDVAATSFAHNSVGCIFNLGVTTGTSATTYSPKDSVTREQMAAFIERLYERLTGESCGGSHPFVDVARSSFANGSIACIHGLGITTGTSATTYGPKQTVTREQMAAFIARLYRLLSGEDCASEPGFGDVSSSSFARRDIGCIFDLGVTTGTSASTYAPAQTVTREQMAAFIARLYILLSS